jgi:signal transduction histidine kinase/PAS domain-containing protein
MTMPRLSLSSLRFRLLLLVLLAVVPALGLTLYTYTELRRLTASEGRREALRLTRIAASDQEDTIKDTRQLLFALAQLPQVHGTDPAACSEFFARLLNQYPQYALLGVIARDGDVLCSAIPTERPVNMANRDYFQRVLQTRGFAMGDYQRDPISGKATLGVARPVLDETGQVQAVVFASLDLTWLNQLAAKAQLPAGSTFTVIDRNGTILVRYPDPETWVGLTMDEAPIVETILAQRGEGTAEVYGVDGIPRLFAFTPLSGAPAGGDVYVSIGIPTTVAFADANRVLARNLAGLGLVTALALAAAWLGGDAFILRRVNRLVRATKQLSAGDLSARAGLPYGSGELGQLAHAFDEMAASLEQGVDERDRAEEELRESQRALSTLMSNLPGMAYRCRNDRDRTMDFVSDGCFDLIDYRPSELIGNQAISYGQLIHPDDRESVWNEVQAALQEHIPFQVTYRITTATGEEKWAWEQGRGVFSPRGDLVALEGYVIDATERVLAHQTLEQRVADRTRDLAALYGVMAVTSGSLDLQTVLESSLDPVLTAMGSEVGAIHLLDETTGTLRLAAWRGIPQDLLAEIDPVPVDGGLAGQVVERGEPLAVPNVANDLRPLLALPISGTHAFVGAPIRAKGQVLGVLSVIGETGRRFKPEEVTLLASIADEVGVAVENARLYGAERARRHQADTLLRVASVVGSTLELDEVLARILDQLRRVVDYDSASVQLLQEENLRVIAGQGFADTRQVVGTAFPRSEEWPNWKVVAKGRPLNLADAPLLYPAFCQSPHDCTRSWLGVPLRVQERIIGMIALDRQQPGGYTEEDVRLATAFADMAALAIENARLYRQAEQLAVVRERERLARELHDSVTQSLYSLTLLAEAGRRLAGAGDLERVEKHLDRLGEISQQALKEMRLLVYELRPLVLRREGLVGALQQRLDAVEKRAGTEARLLTEGEIELSAPVEEALYRIAQEALNNALKHAAATSVTVRIHAEDDVVTLEVVDNGRGFDAGVLGDTGGLGLLSMRERAERLKGTLTILSAPGQGTSVQVCVKCGT